MPEQGKCRSCGADVMWLRSGKTGCLMILDAAPKENGNIALKDDLAWVMRGDMFEEQIDGPRYQDHHASCPQAEQWRKRKRQ